MKQTFNIVTNNINNKTESHPHTLAALSKLVVSNNINKRVDFKDMGLTHSLLQTRDLTKSKIEGNDDILVLFPDTALAIEMIISSMLSPNDMVTRNLLYHAPEELEISPTMKQEIMKIIKDHMNKEYKFESKFAEIIKESLFTKGAYVEVIIPEASFDDFINKPGMESTHGYGQYDLSSKKYLGDLGYEDIKEIKNMVAGFKTSPELNKRFNISHGNNQKSINPSFSFESIGNVNTLHSKESNNAYSKAIKLPTISDKAQDMQSAVEKAKNKAKEIFNSHSTNTDVYMGKAKEYRLDRVFKNISKTKKGTNIEFINVASDASRKSIGKPLVMKIPAESVIPVHAVNDPKIKIGYFIAVDELGEPISVNKEIGEMINQYSPYGDTYGNGKEFINKGVNNLYSQNTQDPMFEENERIYSQIVDEMIKRKIKNGDLKNLVDIQSNLDIYRMMFYRTLRDRETKLIFLPDELVCYWAFNFRPNGTGESLLERVAPLFSIRGILLMVTILSYIKNSTTTTKVRIDLDENESMPEARAEEIQNFLLQNREMQFPLGMMRIYELQDWALRSGYQFEINSPNLPELKIESEQSSPDFKVPDNELDELFFEKILNTFGIVPEMVKQGMDPDFATTTALRNVLNNQRIKEKQKIFNDLASSSIQKFIKSDPTLKEKLIVHLAANIDTLVDQYVKAHDELKIDVETVDNDIKETIIAYILNSIIENMTVTLPEPRSTEAPLLFNAIQAEFQQINDILDNIFDSEAFSDGENGELANKMAIIKGAISLQMKVDRLADYNLMPEIMEIFNLGDGDTGSALLNNFLGNRDAFIQNATRFLANVKGQTKIADTAIGLIENGEENNDSNQPSDGGDMGQQDPSSNDMDGDMGGDMDEMF